MNWKTKLQLMVVLVMVGLYAWGYFVVRSSKYVWNRLQSGAQRQVLDGRIGRILFTPMEYVEKLTKDSAVDVEKWVNGLEKKLNPDGPAVTEEELGRRFGEAHQQGDINKIRSLFYRANLHDDDARQIKRFFDFNLVSLSYADLPRESVAHSRFEDDLVVTRMMVVGYSRQHALLPHTARFYIGTREGRHFLALRYRDG